MSAPSKPELLGAWMRGESTAELAAPQLGELAGEGMRQNADAYSNPKHKDHGYISEELRSLYAQADAKTTPGEQPV